MALKAATSCFTVIFMLVVSAVLVAFPLHASAAHVQENCPCETEDLCRPLSAFPEKEILGFMVSTENWRLYNWSQLTTLAVFTKMTSQQLSDLVCFAHGHHVRVVLHADYPVSDLDNADSRKKWVTDLVSEVVDNYLDGINIDIEQAINKNSANVTLLTELVQEAYTQFKSVNPGYQVTFDVAWSPYGIDDRWYDYKSIALYTDFLVIMSYDERSQIWTGPCVAGANSANATTSAGVMGYLKIAPADKLVLGLPWYGYDYPCETLSTDGVCSIKKVSFRGASCSDAAGTQRDFDEILSLLSNSSTGRIFDKTTASPYFVYSASDGSHQVWYDDVVSLTIKYEFAKETGLKGLAFWNIDSLSYAMVSGQLPEPTVKMWSVIDNFLYQ